MELAHPHFLQPFDNVLQNGTPLHREHGFGDLLGEVAHAGSFSGSEDDSLGHDASQCDRIPNGKEASAGFDPEKTQGSRSWEPLGALS